MGSGLGPDPFGSSLGPDPVLEGVGLVCLAIFFFLVFFLVLTELCSEASRKTSSSELVSIEISLVSVSSVARTLFVLSLWGVDEPPTLAALGARDGDSSDSLLLFGVA